MNSRPPRRVASLASAVVVAALIVGAGIFASSYIGTARTVTRTTTSTTTVSTTVVSYSTEAPLLYSSAVSPEGLQLQVALNSSTLQTHGAVSVQIELLNTLNRNVTLAALTNQNMSGWNAEDFLCAENPSSSLVGFALFKGHFSEGNVSAAGPLLQLAPPLTPPCPMRLGINDTTFLPNSDETMSSYLGQTGVVTGSYPVTAEVNATTGYCFSSGTSLDCPTSSGLFGYWTPGPYGSTVNATLISKAFVYFTPGEYTIVATDDWNQYVYAYFVVL